MSVAAVSVLSAVCLHAEPQTAVPEASDGEKLEREMAADINAKNWTAVDGELPRDFNPFIRAGCEIERWQWISHANLTPIR